MKDKITIGTKICFRGFLAEHVIREIVGETKSFWRDDVGALWDKKDLRMRNTKGIDCIYAYVATKEQLENEEKRKIALTLKHFDYENLDIVILKKIFKILKKVKKGDQK